jgi:hypothetical protein
MSWKKLAIVCLIASALVATVAAQEAKVKIHVTPDEAYLWVDGKAVGDGDQTLMLSPGTHSLTFYNYGFKPATKEITVQAGKNEPVVVAMEPSGAPVSGPWGRLQIEGVDRDTILLNGKTPDYHVGHGDMFNHSYAVRHDELIVPAGTYLVTAVGPNGEAWSGTVKVEANQRVAVDTRKSGATKATAWEDGAKFSGLPRFTSEWSSRVVVAPVSGTFSATPNKIDCNQPVRLAWSTVETLHANVASTQGNFDELPLMEMSASGTTLKGDKIVTPRATTTYNFRSAGPGGVVEGAGPVEVNPVIKSSLTSSMPEILYLKVGDKVMVQDSTTLNWTTYNADTVGLNPLFPSETRFTAPKDDLNLSGSRTVAASPRQTTVGPVNESDTYTLASSNVCTGSDSQATTVTTRGLIESPMVSVFFPTAYPMKGRPNVGLVASQKEELKRVAAIFKLYMERNSGTKLMLEGHADKRGGVGENMKLAERRLARVKAFLVEQGVSADSIETKAYGDENRLSLEEVEQLEAQNPNGQSAEKQRERVQRAYNRRVDVSVGGVQSGRYYPYKAEDAKVMASFSVVSEAAVKKAE